jgi:lysyl-tRNA synthetase class 2
MPQPWTRLADRLPALRRRAALAAAVRAFFTARGYLEVETQYIVPAPGEEAHIPTIQAGHGWLHTSPEFAMKKLLAAGAGPIFQLARVWRDEPMSPTHLPEFTMLEWYNLNPSMDALIEESFALLRATLPPTVSHAGITTSLARHERLTVADAFARHTGADILATAGDAAALAAAAHATLRPNESWEDLFFRLLLERIEPHLGRDHPTYLTHWPIAQAALARPDPADPRVAERFELYVAGVELANAFIELTDAEEQRTRFTANRTHPWPLDEDFLDAVSHLPPSAGIALGFDRLAMLATSAAEVRQAGTFL